MKQAIKELIDLVKGKSHVEAEMLINEHFKTMWSLESDEWNNRMTNEEKARLIEKLINWKK